MKAQKLDALLFPAPSGAGIAARPGYPTVIVPFGLVMPVVPPNQRAVPGRLHAEARRPTASASPEWRAANRG